MDNNILKYFNLWSLEALLYGIDDKKREQYRNKNDIKVVLNAPFVFNTLYTHNEKILKQYSVSSAEKFIRLHLNISDETAKELIHMVEPDPQKASDNHPSYIYSNSMKILNSKNDKKGSNYLMEYFSRKYSSQKDINELIEKNIEIVAFWEPVNFKSKIREYILFILGEEDSITWSDTKEFEEYKNHIEKKKNQTINNEKKREIITSYVTEALYIILYMLDHSDDTYDSYGEILTWLFLIAFLRDDIKDMSFYYQLKNSNPDFVNIANRSLAINSKSSTDAIFVTTKELKEVYGWTEQRIAQSVVFNDKILYGISSDGDTEGTPEHWAEHIESRPDTFGYIYSPHEKNTIIGNYSFCGLRIPKDNKQKKALIDKIEKGNLLESQLKAEEVSSLAVSDTHCILYILNLSMNKGEEGECDSNYEVLMDNFLNTIKEYAKQRVFFDCAYTRLFIKKHYSFYEDLGFENIENIEYDQVENRMYKMENFPYDLKWKGEIVDEIIALYNERVVERTTFRPCEKKDLSDYAIYDLIYKTDPYIYPSLLGSIENCREALSLVYEKNIDSMFNYSNLFIAKRGSAIVGIILWHKGKLNWTNDVIKASLVLNGIKPPKHFEKVSEEYFSQYNKPKKDSVEILNLCIAEKYRNLGIGKEFLESFLKWRKEKEVILYCLEDNESANKLYQNLNFKQVDIDTAYTPNDDDSIKAIKYILKR